MIVDEQGNAVPYFKISKPWASDQFHETADLGEAVMFACAIALHRGFGVEVSRIVPNSTPTVSGDRFSLFTVTPNSIDFRKVKPETILGMKAFASSLIANIDDVAPPAEKEGFDK
jgi:hypothetical protein